MSKSKSLKRIANALERIAPPPPNDPDWAHHAYIWQASPLGLQPVENVDHVEFDVLVGIDRAKMVLLQNSEQFARGYSGNNALLWGARGMGKSSLVKSIHARLQVIAPVILVEIAREDLATIGALLTILRRNPERRFILFCDDLSFSYDDVAYKSLKAVLDGGIAGRPQNVLFYATSNRRHLMPRDMIENERASAINPSEAVEEKVSLSDRFGLWLGFHPCSQDEYFAIIEGYLNHSNISATLSDWRAEAIEWQVTRGARSGRVAWQFVVDYAGRHAQKLENG